MQYATSARGLVAEMEAKIAAKIIIISTKRNNSFLVEEPSHQKVKSHFHLKRIPTSYVLLLCWTLNMICGLHNCNIQLLQILKSVHEYQQPSTLQETPQGPSQGPQEFIPCNHYLLLPN